MRECSLCKDTKSWEHFPKNSKGLNRRGQVCKSCSAKRTAKYREDNYHLVYANKFGTTEDTIRKVLDKNICDICGTPPSNKRHSIDHCHSTGVIRGLLCDACNTGLGKFKDNTNLLQKAIKYLNGN